MTQETKNNTACEAPPVAPEQMAYANLLSYGANAGMLICAVTYMIYVFGVIEPHVSTEMVIQYWGTGVHDFIEHTGAPAGWDWVSLLGKGDYLNFIGLALLAVLSIICYCILVPAYFKRGDKVYGIICVLEIIVLTLAASGLLGSGGH